MRRGLKKVDSTSGNPVRERWTLTDGDLVVCLATLGVFVVNALSCNPWVGATRQNRRKNQTHNFGFKRFYESVCQDYWFSRLLHPPTSELRYYSLRVHFLFLSTMPFFYCTYRAGRGASMQLDCTQIRWHQIYQIILTFFLKFMSIAAAFIQFVPITFLLSYVCLASAPAHNCDQFPHNVSIVFPSLGHSPAESRFSKPRLGSPRLDSRFQLTLSCAVACTLFAYKGVCMECVGNECQTQSVP